MILPYTRQRFSAKVLILSFLLSPTLALSAQALADTATSPERQLTIGVSVSDLGNPYFSRLVQGAERKAAELTGGQAQVLLVSSAYDVQRQTQQLDLFIQQGVDMILLSAAAYDAFDAVIARAQAAGIKVLAVDVRARGADATVTTDNLQAGHIACDHLARQLQGSGEVVILNGPPVSSIIERVQGCREALQLFPDITLLSSDRNSGGSLEGGVEAMTHLLLEHPQIKGVFAINDPAALGAEMAGQLANRKDFMIVSVDGAPAAVERIRDPDALLRATATQSPAQMAELAVEIGYQLLQGEQPDQTEHLLPATLITSENANQTDGW
ncbi:ABC transporter substrate-binding protein [Nitrincola alkalilacustris]|uniref:ABC transporter substrate-binding protein n=1 Tax=Nitrincola alkalilacustris TaxID=1571224 RepID=UPI00124E2CDD|nr:ABC transporter substrate-binding protein [Nitrincola alkalilacustris]